MGAALKNLYALGLTAITTSAVAQADMTPQPDHEMIPRHFIDIRSLPFLEPVRLPNNYISFFSNTVYNVTNRLDMRGHVPAFQIHINKQGECTAVTNAFKRTVHLKEFVDTFRVTDPIMQGETRLLRPVDQFEAIGGQVHDYKSAQIYLNTLPECQRSAQSQAQPIL